MSHWFNLRGAGWPGVHDLARRALHERMEPGRAAAAVLVGITLGIVPIYGAQSIVAIGLATLLHLNRPLTLAATFINNPVLQPLLLLGSFQLGYYALHGAWTPLAYAIPTVSSVREGVAALFIGSFILAGLLGGTAATATYLFLVRGSEASRRANDDEAAWRAHAASCFRTARWRDRGFVRWKTRLDRIFALLLSENLGTGPAVDLGCGHGTALAVIAFRDPHRPLHGCDLDPARVRAARLGLSAFDARVSCADVRTFPLPSAGLILIMDVLQYLCAADQVALLRRCADALAPGGRLIFRLPAPGREGVSRLTRTLDRFLLALGGSRRRPVYQPVDVYERLLTEAAMRVEVRHCRNRLPLAHAVITATKPEPAS